MEKTWKNVAVLCYTIFIITQIVSIDASRLSPQQQQAVRSKGITQYYIFEPRIHQNGAGIGWPLTSQRSSIDIDFYGQKLTLDLQLNQGLIAHQFRHFYQQNGRQISTQGLIRPFCYYHGRIREHGKVNTFVLLLQFCPAFSIEIVTFFLF